MGQNQDSRHEFEQKLADAQIRRTRRDELLEMLMGSSEPGFDMEPETVNDLIDALASRIKL